MALSSEDEKFLRTFQRRVQDLEGSGLAASGRKKVTVRLAGKGPRMSGIDRDHLWSFCTTLRQFNMQRDAVNFSRVCNLVYQHCDDPELRGWSAHFRKRWGEAWGEPLGIGIGETVAVVPDDEIPPPADPSTVKSYSAEEFFETWINGLKTHSNPAKLEELDSMPSAAPEILEMMFIGRLPTICHPLQMMSLIISVWLDGVEAEVGTPPAAQ
ncbi:MAG: hypothetical protein GY930_21665 [bacterium]|nr:hypothetical protein [bacterium]